MTARAILAYGRTIRKQPSNYIDCGVTCGADGKPNKEFCVACPIGRAVKVRDAEIKTWIEKTPGAEKFKPENLISDVLHIRKIESSYPDGGYNPIWTVLQANLVDVYRSEQNRLDSIMRDVESQDE